jgi:hypothetical protein
MKLKMESAAAETTTKKISPRLPPSLVFAAALVTMIAAIAGLITLTLSMIATQSSSSSLASSTTMVLRSLSSPTLKAYIDPDLFSYEDPNERLY